MNQPGPPTRTYLVVIDDSAEARVALRFAARRAQHGFGVSGAAERDVGVEATRTRRDGGDDFAELTQRSVEFRSRRQL